MTQEQKAPLIWYALRCVPQREDMCAKILRYHGIDAFVKTERRLRRKTKRDTVRRERHFVVASSYIFVGIPETDSSPWQYVHRYHMIRSVVSLNGRPVRLDPRALGEFLGFDDFDMPEYFKFFRTNQPAFAPGDSVRIDLPWLEGFTLPVKDIQRGEAIFDLVFNSATSELRVPLEQCYKAA